MQVICTSHQTGSHATSSLNFYRPDGLAAAQPTVKAVLTKIYRKQMTVNQKSINKYIIMITNKCWLFLD